MAGELPSTVGAWSAWSPIPSRQSVPSPREDAFPSPSHSRNPESHTLALGSPSSRGTKRPHVQTSKHRTLKWKALHSIDSPMDPVRNAPSLPRQMILHDTASPGNSLYHTGAGVLGQRPNRFDIIGTWDLGLGTWDRQPRHVNK